MFPMKVSAIKKLVEHSNPRVAFSSYSVWITIAYTAKTERRKSYTARQAIISIRKIGVENFKKYGSGRTSLPYD